MTFVYVVRPGRERFRETVSDAEMEVIGEHFMYIKRAYDAGKVRLVGRCEDAAFGLVIFDADGEAQAREFAENDPAVKAGIFAVEVREFRVVLPQAS
jgi:uncharacterized protein YciI